MDRLPVFGIFSRSLAFVVVNFPTIVRLTWLPLVLLAAFQAAGELATLNATGAGIWDRETWPQNSQFQPVLDAFVKTLPVTQFILEIVASAAAAVALHRVILFDDRQPGRYFVFPFGWTELLYVLMIVIWMMMVIAISIPFGLAIAILVPRNDLSALFQDGGLAQVELASWAQTIADGAAQMSPLQALAAGAIVLLMMAFLIWLSIRLFVWPAALVARRKLSLGYAWSLTLGNAWAIFGLYVLSLLTLIALTFAVATVAPGAFMPPDGVTDDPAAPNIDLEDKTLESFGKAADAQTGADSPVAEAAPAQTGARVQPADAPQQGSHPLLRHVLLKQLVELLLNFLFIGYGVALVSHSYRALSGHDPANPDRGD